MKYIKSFLDLNKNAVKDVSEPYFDDAKLVTIKPGQDTIVSQSSNGRTRVNIGKGSYITTVVPYRPYYIVVPASHTTTYTTYLNSDTAVFALQPSGSRRDLAVSIYAQNIARPGFPLSYQLICKNKGTDTVLNATVELIKDSRINFVSAYPSIASVSGDTLRWNLGNFFPDQEKSIDVSLNVSAPPIVQIGDGLLSSAKISSTVTDVYTGDNAQSFWQYVRGAIDPNDKSESHAGRMRVSDATGGEYLQYTIRFQNTGNDTAFTVAITDTLSNLLDWSSLEMVSASANYKLTINDGSKLLWLFNNINLVDSNKNEVKSHGYLVYRIKAKPTVAIGNIITNTASIYFDYNLPVQTNTETTYILDNLLPLNILSFTAQRLRESNMLQWTTANEINTAVFEIEKSRNGKDFGTIGQVKTGKGQYKFTDNNPSRGNNYYRLKILDKDGTFNYSIIRMINNNGGFYVNIYPNPAIEKLQVEIVSDNKNTLQMQIVRQEGKAVLSGTWSVQEGTAIRTINIAALSKGLYYLKISSTGKEDAIIKFEKL